jgi:hypothetical protein
MAAQSAFRVVVEIRKYRSADHISAGRLGGDGVRLEAFRRGRDRSGLKRGILPAWSRCRSIVA